MLRILTRLRISTPQQPTHLRRRWVETADPRCPLACVWFALPEIAADESSANQPPANQPAALEAPPAELPQLAQPAFSRRGAGRLFAPHSSCSGILYLIAA